MANLLNRALAWVGNVYNDHGWQAALVVLVVIVLVISGVASYFNLDLGALLGVQ